MKAGRKGQMAVIKASLTSFRAAPTVPGHPWHPVEAHPHPHPSSSRVDNARWHQAAVLDPSVSQWQRAYYPPPREAAHPSQATPSSPSWLPEYQPYGGEASAPGPSSRGGQGEEEHPEGLDSLWLAVRAEARRDAEAEPALASYLSSVVLAHRSLETALASHLANKLASPTLLSCQLAELFRSVLLGDAAVSAAMRRDMEAARERDPACSGFLHCMLNFKGFAALQTHRVAHHLWGQNRHALALALHSRACEVFHVDIHPGARLGHGVLLDHATGIVVGETAEVGDDVTILHNVTLGGDRPRIGNGVVLGTGVRVFGPAVVGDRAKVGALSVVLQSVAEGATAVGNPAKEVKRRESVSTMLALDYMI